MNSSPQHLPVLLVGNSPNRLGGGGLSWPQLLDKLRGSVGLSPDGHDTKPFTLHFEEILSQHRHRNVGGVPLKKWDAELRKVIATTMKKMVPNDVHRDLMNLPVEGVLTTNYDFCLERALIPDLKKDPLLEDWGTNEKRYCLFLRRAASDKFVFHIHGDIGKPGLIILGHEGYMESAARIRLFSLKQIADPNRRDGDGKNRIPNPGLWYNNIGFQKAKYRDSTASIIREEPHSWVDLFMMRDVHIVGLGLDFTEADLWYLISYKARLKYEADVHKDLKNSTIYFHYFADKDQALVEKVQMLRCFDVECREHPIPENGKKQRDYDSAWKDLVLSLDEEIRKTRRSQRRRSSQR